MRWRPKPGLSRTVGRWPASNSLSSLSHPGLQTRLASLCSEPGRCRYGTPVEAGIRGKVLGEQHRRHMTKLLPQNHAHPVSVSWYVEDSTVAYNSQPTWIIKEPESHGHAHDRMCSDACGTIVKLKSELLAIQVPGRDLMARQLLAGLLRPDVLNACLACCYRLYAYMCGSAKTTQLVLVKDVELADNLDMPRLGGEDRFPGEHRT